jgi:hypothetical protein
MRNFVHSILWKKSKTECRSIIGVEHLSRHMLFWDRESSISRFILVRFDVWTRIYELRYSTSGIHSANYVLLYQRRKDDTWSGTTCSIPQNMDSFGPTCFLSCESLSSVLFESKARLKHIDKHLSWSFSPLGGDSADDLFREKQRISKFLLYLCFRCHLLSWVSAMVYWA